MWPKKYSPILIGRDFIQVNNITNNRAKSEMQVGNSKVEFLPLWKVVPHVCTASLKENVTVSPRSEMTVLAKLEPVRNYEVVPDGFDGILEAKEIFRNDEVILIARTAGIVSQGTTPLRLMNASESEIEVRGKTILGSFYAAMPENVKSARVDFYEFVKERANVNISMAQEVMATCKDKSTSIISWEHSVLNSSQRRKADAIVSKFSDMFSDSKSNIGRTGLIQHSIDTGDSRPIKQPPRRIPFAMREELGKQVQEMLEHDIIEPSKSHHR